MITLFLHHFYINEFRGDCLLALQHPDEYFMVYPGAQRQDAVKMAIKRRGRWTIDMIPTGWVIS